MVHSTLGRAAARKTLTRRGALALAGGLLLAPSVLRAQARPIGVRFTVQPGTLVTTLVETAVEQGLFAAVGIDAQTVSVAHGPAAVTALASSSVDIATNAPEVFLALASRGQSLNLVAGQTKQLGVLMARPGFAFPAEFPGSVAALRGKKIGVTALSSATQYLAITMLLAAGLRADDASFVAVGTGAPQALVNGVVDAAFVTGPQVVISESLGCRPVVDLRSTEGCPAQLGICGIGQVGMWAMGEWIGRNGEALARVRKAIARADLFLHNEANAVAVRRAIFAQIPADSADTLKQGYLSYALSVLSAAFARRDLERWIEIDHMAGVIASRLPVETVFADGTPETAQAVRELAA